jgi:hypothetical protein
MMFNVTQQCSLQLSRTAMHTTPQLPFGQQSEKALHLIDPGGAGGGEVEMVIGHVGLAEISSPLRIAERRLNRGVNTTTYTAEEFTAKVKSNHHFIATVMRSKKLFILGDPCEFGRTFGTPKETRLRRASYH